MKAKSGGIVAAIMAKGKPAMPMESPEEMQGNDMGLEMAAEELVKAVHARDAAQVAEALKNAFAILSSEPQEVE